MDVSEVFKAYDVRGMYGKNFTETVVYEIGKAFVTFLNCKKLVVGYDMRKSSPKLSRAFMKGVTELGVDVIDIGSVSTDGLYFAAGFLNLPGVMFTASHNPPQYNGMKFCRAKAVPLNYDNGLRYIEKIVENKKFRNLSKKKGRITKKNILNNYVRHLHTFIHKKKLKKLKIAVDAGNGMAGKTIPLVFKALPPTIVPLFFKLDGTFPNHLADPSKSENLKQLQKTVKAKQCDFGMAFDGDADRVFFVDENGRVINSSFISAMIIKNILSKKKRQPVIYNLICSKIVPETIRKYRSKAIKSRVGHSYIKEKMKQTKAVFACEHSAHYFFRDNFNADSGLIAGLIVTEIVSESGRKLSELVKEFEVYYKIEETNFKVPNKQKTMEKIKNHYKNKKNVRISLLDGITVSFRDWWFNVRPSNTEPLLRLNLEADSEKLMVTKTREVIVLIKQ